MNKTELAQKTKSALNITEKISSTWKSRLAGSIDCLQCADYLREQFSTFCTKTQQELFSVRPGAFLGFIRIIVVLYFVSLLALVCKQFYVAVVPATLSLLIIVLEFFFYKEFVDFLYPQKEGKNVYGIIEPVENVTQQIIVSGHHDSAHVMNFLETNSSVFNRKVYGGIAPQFALFTVSWLFFVFSEIHYVHPVVFWIIIIGFFSLSYSVVSLWFSFDAKKGTPGAGDNIISSAIAIEIGKYFAHEKQLKHTRIIVASWDAEECGLRGSRHFVKLHKEYLQEVKTYNLNFECMYNHKEMHFLESDLNGLVPLSKEMIGDCIAISNQLGYQVKTQPLPFFMGSTDSAEFAKQGIDTTCLVAMNWNNRGLSEYHTTRDTIDAVDEEAVYRSIEIGIYYIERKDSAK